MMKLFCDGCGVEIMEAEHGDTARVLTISVASAFGGDPIEGVADACSQKCVPAAMDKMHSNLQKAVLESSAKNDAADAADATAAAGDAR